MRKIDVHNFHIMFSGGTKTNSSAGNATDAALTWEEIAGGGAMSALVPAVWLGMLAVASIKKALKTECAES